MDRLGKDRLGPASPGLERMALDWTAWQGTGMAPLREANNDFHLGLDWHGVARPGVASRGSDCNGLERQGVERHGMAPSGSARFFAGTVMAGKGMAWKGMATTSVVSERIR